LFKALSKLIPDRESFRL